jgi:hypothetical protein
VSKRTREDFESIIGRHGSLEAAVSACRSVAEVGDRIEIHAGDCPFDEDGDGCICEPIVIVVRRANAKA